VAAWDKKSCSKEDKCVGYVVPYFATITANKGLCPKNVNCDATWTLTKCAKECGRGTQKATYAITTAAAQYGTACEAKDNAFKNKICNDLTCKTVRVKTILTASLPAEMLVAGSATRAAFEAAFVGGIAKATGLPAPNIKVDSITNARRRVLADVSCKVAYTIPIPKGTKMLKSTIALAGNTKAKDPKMVAATVAALKADPKVAAAVRADVAVKVAADKTKADAAKAAADAESGAPGAGLAALALALAAAANLAAVYKEGTASFKIFASRSRVNCSHGRYPR